MTDFQDTSKARAVFSGVVDHARFSMILALIFIVLAGFGLGKIVKDPSTDSLIPPDHTSIQMRAYAEDVFGLRDPIVVSVTSDGPNGVFTPVGLETLSRLHDYLTSMENVRPDRVLSIASESRIFGSEDALHIERFFDDVPSSQTEADQVKSAVFKSAPHISSIVSKDGSGALIIAELYDDMAAAETYEEIVSFAKSITHDSIQINVAGQGAVTGYLSALIDIDARRLPPVATLVIFILIYLAFGRLKALIPPLIVTLATVCGTIGIMAWLGIPYFVITGALPVILIAIAVADSIHILTGYYERIANDPDKPKRDIIVETLTDLWRPLTLTTFTTMAGFIGLALAAVMPPMVYFGWFAALGVFIAWAVTLFVLPAILQSIQLGPSLRIRPGTCGGIANRLTHIAQYVARYPARILAVVGVILFGAMAFASNVQVNSNRIENFKTSQPIRVADTVLNNQFAGTSYLDVVVKAESVEGLLNARYMQKIAELQTFLEAQPHVNKTTSIADYLSELHTALTGADAGVLPSDDNAIAQYLLTYEASGNSTDLEDEIDTDYQHALVRAYLSSQDTDSQAPVVEALEDYLLQTFNGPSIKGFISGRVNVDYHWMESLGQSHFRGVILSLIFVFTLATLLFRSAALGLLSLVPVGVALLSVYGLMGITGIFIEPGTAMFAAIAIGVGVDFSVHFIDRLQKGIIRNKLSLEETIATFFPSSARACFFNASALTIGFSVLMISELPPIFKLGLLITVAAISSFLGGFIITTASFALFRKRSSLVSRRALAVVAILVGVTFSFVTVASASSYHSMTARQIAEKVDARYDGESRDSRIRMELIDRRGKSRVREARAIRRDGDTVTKSVIFYTAPSALRGTAFLSHDDQVKNSADRQWLYIPATKRPKQIPASDRGDYFLGTDFTYEDIKTELKFNLEDYTFTKGKRLQGDPVNSVRLIAKPINEEVSQELGYGYVEALINTDNWLPTNIQFEDARGQALKTISVSKIDKIANVWTATRIEAVHLQNNHKTVFIYQDINFDTELNDRIFSPQGLGRGAP